MSFWTRYNPWAVLARIERKVDEMAADITSLQQSVNDTVGVEESAIALLGSLSQQIADLKNDPAALQALADQLNSEKSKLADAVAANSGS